MKGRPEAHRIFEETNFEQSQRKIPIGEEKKDHRINFTIGAFNDGLKSNFCKNIVILIVFRD